MFVAVTVAAILTSWLLWNWVKVRERERLLVSLVGQSNSSASANARDLWIHRRKGAKPPWLWGLMGATNEYGNILCEIESDGELDHIQALLPDYELTLMPIRTPVIRRRASSVEKIMEWPKE